MKKTLLTSLAIILFTIVAFAQVPGVFTINGETLLKNKQAYQNGDKLVSAKVEDILARANQILKEEPHSVMDKNFTPTSGSKHDYMSLGPYWWPDKTKTDGLPYIRKDGQRNPEIKKITDREYLGELEGRCVYLALAYYFTDKEVYATKARMFLKVWFINPETKMNPNLNFGQAIPGLNNGRGIGIIETRLLVDILNWTALLNKAEDFRTEELLALKSWFKEYLAWMLSSKNGLDEKESKNNHGTFYDLQVLTFASFLEDTSTIKMIISRSATRQTEQFETNGKQPLELERTNALSYSTMNLSGWFSMAILAEKNGFDLWKTADLEHANLKKALDWLIPYAFDKEKFDYQQIGGFNYNNLYPLLLIAKHKYHTDSYDKNLLQLEGNKDNSVADLVY